jgi:hypothetical protein
MVLRPADSSNHYTHYTGTAIALASGILGAVIGTTPCVAMPQHHLK